MQKAEVRLFSSKKKYFTSEKFISDSYGRYVIVAGRLLDKQVILVNIYAPNFDDSHFFSRVSNKGYFQKLLISWMNSTPSLLVLAYIKKE